MKIGLIDLDILGVSPLKSLNVELMKIAKYYEENGWEVNLLFSQDDIFEYNKIVVFANDKNMIQKEIDYYATHPYVNFIGQVFQNGEYVSIDSEDINNQPTDTKYYKKLLDKLSTEGKYKKSEVTEMLEAKWIRLFISDSLRANLDCLYQGEKVCLVDNYFFQYSDWEEYLLNFNMFNHRIHFTNRIVIKTDSDVKNFSKLQQTKIPKIKTLICIEETEELINFLTKHQEVFRSITTEYFFINLFYSNNNIYSSDFLDKKAQEYFQVLLTLNNLAILTVPMPLLYLTKSLDFATILLRTLSTYTSTQHNNYRTFEFFFNSIYGRSPETMKRYKHYVSKRPLFEEWSKQLFTNKKEAYNGFEKR